MLHPQRRFDPLPLFACLLTGLSATTAQAQSAEPPAALELAPEMTPEPVAALPGMDLLQEHLPAPVLAAAEPAARFLRDGGPAIWAIAALSVITATIILWKIWRLALAGAWSKGRARRAVAAYETGQADQAVQIVARRRGVRSRVVLAALRARASKPDDLAREETIRVARHELAEAATGLRALELISTIAPLLGLLGTVLGMIAAFQALQQSGSRADPALLAGGIWEALLTTAAGMGVAIPASAALAWFESVIDRMRRDSEDAMTRIFVAARAEPAAPVSRVGATPALAAAAE